MLKLNKVESRLHYFTMEVIHEVMDNYGYDYVIGDKLNNKYYTSNGEYISVSNNNEDILVKGELISLGYYLIKRLGLEDIELSINKECNICNLLNILNIEYLCNIDTSDTWKLVYDNIYIVEGNNNSFKIDISKLIDILKSNINIDALNRVLDVNIIGDSEEEKYYALKIAQDLRLNNINTEINSNTDSKFNIVLDEDNLKKGIVTIKDKLLKEEIKLDEKEVIDYFLGNI